MYCNQKVVVNDRFHCINLIALDLTAGNFYEILSTFRAYLMLLTGNIFL